VETTVSIDSPANGNTTNNSLNNLEAESIIQFTRVAFSTFAMEAERDMAGQHNNYQVLNAVAAKRLARLVCCWLQLAGLAGHGETWAEGAARGRQQQVRGERER